MIKWLLLVAVCVGCEVQVNSKPSPPVFWEVSWFDGKDVKTWVTEEVQFKGGKSYAPTGQFIEFVDKRGMRVYVSAPWKIERIPIPVEAENAK